VKSIFNVKTMKTMKKIATGLGLAPSLVPVGKIFNSGFFTQDKDGYL
jgi:hypothetical protein